MAPSEEMVLMARLREVKERLRLSPFERADVPTSPITFNLKLKVVSVYH